MYLRTDDNLTSKSKVAATTTTTTTFVVVVEVNMNVMTKILS